MPRGGKRPGAGRPAGSTVLTWEEEFIIGGECQARWQAAWDANWQAARDALFGKSDYDAQIAVLHVIPVEDRKAFHRTEAGEYHRDDIEGARKVMADMDPADLNEAPRIFHIRPARPYGQKALIRKEVSAWASERFDKPISERMVRSCWDMFRAISADDD